MCWQRALAALLLVLLAISVNSQSTRLTPSATRQLLQQRIAAGRFSQAPAPAAVEAADASVHLHLLGTNAAKQFQRRLAAFAAAVVPGRAAVTANSLSQGRKRRRRTTPLARQAKEAATWAQAGRVGGTAGSTSSNEDSNSISISTGTGRTSSARLPSSSIAAAAASSANTQATDWIGQMSQPTVDISSPRMRQSFPATSPAGAEVLLDAGSSRAELGSEIRTYKWTIRGASSSNLSFREQATGASATVNLKPGSYTASLEVTSTGSDCAGDRQCTATESVRFSVVSAGAAAAEKGASRLYASTAAGETPFSAIRQPALNKPRPRNTQPGTRAAAWRPGRGGQARSGTIDVGPITAADLFPGITLNPDGTGSTATGAPTNTVPPAAVMPDGSVNPAADTVLPGAAAPGGATPAASAQPGATAPETPGATAPGAATPRPGTPTPPATPPGAPPVVPPVTPTPVPPGAPPAVPPVVPPPVVPPVVPPPVIPPVAPQVPRPPVPPPATPPPIPPPVPAPAVPPAAVPPAVTPAAAPPPLPPPVPPPVAPPPAPGVAPRPPTPPAVPPPVPPPVAPPPVPPPVPAPKPPTPPPVPPPAPVPAPKPPTPPPAPAPGPKPPGPAPTPAPPPSAAGQQEDECNPADYDFKDPDSKEMWKECCDEAKAGGKNDPDCAKPQW